MFQFSCIFVQAGDTASISLPDNTTTPHEQAAMERANQMRESGQNNSTPMSLMGAPGNFFVVLIFEIKILSSTHIHMTPGKDLAL